MNQAEAKILHGIYYHRQMIGERCIYSASELNWLIHNSFEKGRNWQGEDGKLKAIEEESDNYLKSIGATSAASQRPVRYLAAKDYITYSADGGFRIAVSAEGAEIARELDTRMGRLNILYKNHKDGVIWLMATVLVSAVTALLTKCGE